MEEDMKCRRATLADKTAVVNIITAYGGRDYMPAYYNNMIQDPSFIGVLGELHGIVVAFAGAYVINGGTTMMTKGSRVKEELQGQGLYRILWQYLRNVIREQYPDLQYEEFTSNTLSLKIYCGPEKNKYREVYRRPLSEFTVPRLNFEDSSSPHKNHQCVQEMGFSELRLIFENKPLCAILFPKRLVVDWMVYLPKLENVDIIERTGTYVTKTFASDIDSVSFDLGAVIPDLDSKSALIAFGSPFSTSDHLAYTIDFYGQRLLPRQIMEHLKNHARRIMSLYDGEIRFLISADSELMATIEETCHSMGFVPRKFYSTHCVTVARDIS